MFKIALVVFREFIEIAFLLSVILAVTRPVKDSRRYIVLGLICGICMASIFAFAAKFISECMIGVGDEIFNATVALCSALLISWTVIWMQGYSKKNREHLNKLSQEITSGSTSSFMLVGVVATTIFRELTEIILFVYSVASAGRIVGIEYIAGIGIGSFGGIVAGSLFYFGILTCSGKHIFKISTFLLVFIAAGLSAQAAGILTSSGIVEILSDQLWNTSWLVDNASITGKILNAIIGYDARPNGLQILFYLATILFTLIIIKLKLSINHKSN